MWCSGMCRVGKEKGVRGCAVWGLVSGSLCCAGWGEFFIKFPLLLSTHFNSF